MTRFGSEIREDTIPTGEALAPLLYAHNLHVGRSSGGKVAGLTFSLAPGDVVVLTGRGGSGKSRVLSCLVGLEAPLGGEIEVFGERLAALDHDGLMKLRARASLSSVQLPPLANLTVRANLEVPLRMRGLSVEEVQARVDEVLLELDVAKYADRRPHSLPHYGLCRATLARALAIPAELYLLDEPLRAFHDDGEVLLGAMKRRMERGAAFVVTAAHAGPFATLSPRVIGIEALGRVDDAEPSVPLMR